MVDISQIAASDCLASANVCGGSSGRRREGEGREER